MKAETFKLLQQAQVPATQACAIAQAIEIECSAGHDDLATKRDLEGLRLALEQVRAELVRWVFLVVLGQTAVLAAAGYFYIGQLAR